MKSKKLESCKNLTVKPSDVKKGQKTKPMSEATTEECRQNLNKVEEMLHKNGIRVTHEEFEQQAAEAFAEEMKEDNAPGWTALIPSYYAFEWCAEALKAFFGGTGNNVESDQVEVNNVVYPGGETHSNLDQQS